TGGAISAREPPDGRRYRGYRNADCARFRARDSGFAAAAIQAGATGIDTGQLMSLILEALKKSEAERQRQSGPTVLEVRVARPQRRYPIWARAVVVLLVVNMLLLLLFVLRRPATTAPASAPPTTATAPMAATAPAVAT